ncbi:type IV secretion system protein VirB3 [Alterisphingorhabdus coralli]|uniref:VirB3 family type IV secretion system protein n=1 Tax=Alterisphingorhabdus coralli TaxID=3071408 RepID=A0AA97I226_9SPHN|nr:VirB3 family type IV secretion system protein [Parasphingorhabdus sp. SCSIO 66989]WOE76742.1 VirB3 family type IV secretion system protein [Parasphingorhabdus sp. SCSIO 66989]
MDDELSADTLYLALTRPALFLGVPLDAAMFIFPVAVLCLIWTGNPLIALAIGGALYFTARLITRRDYNQFRVLSLYLQTAVGNANKGYWKGSSYGPLASPMMKRKGFLNV